MSTFRRLAAVRPQLAGAEEEALLVVDDAVVILLHVKGMEVRQADT
jgi:hypothetical protein